MRLRAVLSVAAALTVSTGAHAASYVVVTPNYSVVGNRPTAEQVKFATRLEMVRALLESQVGHIPAAAPNQRLAFLVVGDPDDVKRLCGPRCSPDVIGFARNTELGPIAVIPKNAIGNGNYDGQYVLFGIAARDAVSRKFPRDAPEWLELGWAEMVASTNFSKPGKLPLGIVQVFHRLQSRQLRWSNLVDVLDGTANFAKDDRLAGQAMMLMHYLLFAPSRRGQLGAYTAAIMSGKSGAEAAKAFGDSGKLAADLRAYDDLNGLSIRTLPAPAAPANIAASEIPDARMTGLAAAVVAARR